MKIIKSIIIICVSICFLSSCQNNTKVTEKVCDDADVSINNDTSLVINKLDYELFDDEGIVVEKFDSSVKDENRYNQNNKIYIPKTKIRYSCKYIDSKGKELFFRDSDKDDNGLWDFDVSEKPDKSSITSMLITVLPGTIFKHVPNYSQTGIQYEFIRNDGKIAFKKSKTGVVENEANICMHPPRTKNFRVLELNPFPFIKRPYTIGNKWTCLCVDLFYIKRYSWAGIMSTVFPSISNLSF